MTDQKKITGTLKAAVWDNYSPIIWGFLYGDIYSRWRDGTRIHTSKILSCKPGKKPEYVETLNSYYKIEWLGENP